MGIGAFAEPFVVISLLAIGCYVNRETRDPTTMLVSASHKRDDSLESGGSSPSSEAGLLSPLDRPIHDAAARTDFQGHHVRTIQVFGWRKDLVTVNTRQFASRWFSRLIVHRKPFIVEVLYWALIYWVSAMDVVLDAIPIWTTLLGPSNAHQRSR